jgi:hypothetical protein
LISHAVFLLQQRPTSGANYGAPVWNNHNTLTVGQRGEHLNWVAQPWHTVLGVNLQLSS